MRAIASAALAALLATLVLQIAGVGADLLAAYRSPLQLDYGEGIVWQQALRIPGPTMYDTGRGLPFIVFHYPPVYYLLVRAARLIQPEWLAAGRMVASVSALLLPPLIALLILAAVRVRDGRAIAVAVGAGMLVLSLSAVRGWGAVMRVDMPGFVFVLAGLLVATRADGRFWGMIVALFLCAVAVFTKQTLLAAGVAVFLIGMLRRPRPTLAAAALVGAIGVAVVGLLQHLTGGGFLTNIVGNNINRMSLYEGYRVFGAEKASIPVILCLMPAGLWAIHAVAPSVLRLRPARAWRELMAVRGADRPTAARALLLLYFALATLVMLLTIFKTGGYINYLIDWFCAGGIVLGLMLIDLLRGARGRQAAATGLLLFLAVYSLVLPTRRLPRIPDPTALALQDRLVEMIRTADKPVASEDMSLLMRAGRPVIYEPSIVTELASVGRWDETPLLDMIRTHGFAFILTNAGPEGNAERRTPAVQAAIEAAYPRHEQLGPRIWIRRPE